MNAREQLTAWVRQQYAGQTIKRTTEPYFDHLVAVAEMAGPVVKLGYEIGLCHDIFEDTPTSVQQLSDALTGFGYAMADANYIAAGVVELTDVYTKAAYPELSKTIRKQKEAARLATISPAAQTVKYADLVYNIKWVMLYDQKKAAAYLAKKRALVIAMTNGDTALRQQALTLIERCLHDI